MHLPRFNPKERQYPYIRSGPKVGRNDPCPCGSGLKHKHCHGDSSITGLAMELAKKVYNDFIEEKMAEKIQEKERKKTEQGQLVKG